MTVFILGGPLFFWKREYLFIDKKPEPLMVQVMNSMNKIYLFISILNTFSSQLHNRHIIHWRIMKTCAYITVIALQWI